MKMMHVQVFITLALSMPEDRDFQALDILGRNTSDQPAGGQRRARLINGLVTAQP